MAKLVLAEQRYQEPECVFLVLLQVHKGRASDEIHPLRVAERFSLELAIGVSDAEGGGRRKDPV